MQAVFRPGFIAPDLLFIVLIARAYTAGKDTVLWALLGGFLLDLLTDSLGHGIAIQTLSVYIFIILIERLLFKTWLAFLISAGSSALIKKALGIAVMKLKYSFEISLLKFFYFWLIEVFILSLLYFLYLRKKE
jgi:rod shape-determining protein MreD